jgi:hypothetical protein
METTTLLKYFLPKEFAQHFDLTDIFESDKQLTLSLDEKNLKPLELAEKPLESKGFSPPVFIQDFPIRDHQVLLKVKRRIWRDKQTGKTYNKSYQLTHEGTSYTAEFAAFLKSIG